MAFQFLDGIFEIAKNNLLPYCVMFSDNAIDSVLELESFWHYRADMDDLPCLRPFPWESVIDET